MRFTQTNFRKKLSSDLLGNFCIDEMFTQLTDVIKTFKRFSFYLFHRSFFLFAAATAKATTAEATTAEAATETTAATTSKATSRAVISVSPSSGLSSNPQVRRSTSIRLQHTLWPLIRN